MRGSHDVSGSALAAKGFRPFFFAAGLFAVVVVPLWLAMLSGLLPPPTYLGAFGWHAHEMVFGYSAAVIAGFLLTSVSNWTKRETLVGAPLLLLGLLWVLGRVAVSVADSLPRAVPAIVDLAFWPALAVALGRPLVAAKNTRNYGMVAVILGLGVVNATMHLDALGVALFEGWRRRGALVGVDVVIVLILVMAGRVFPMFTRNATGVASIRSLPRVDRASIVAMIAVAIADVAGGASSSVAVGFAVATSKPAVIGLFLVYGLFYAIDEGQTKAYISDLVPDASRATAIGTYGFVTALVYLPASLLAGGLWKAFGPAVAFSVAAGIAIVALVYFLAFQPERARRET